MAEVWGVRPLEKWPSLCSDDVTSNMQGASRCFVFRIQVKPISRTQLPSAFSTFFFRNETRFHLSWTQVSDALSVLFQPERTTLTTGSHPEKSPWLLTSQFPSSSVEHSFLLTCLFPAPSSCCRRASLIQWTSAKSHDVLDTRMGTGGPCLQKPPPGEGSRQVAAVSPTLWPACSRYRASGHSEKRVTNSSPMGSGESFTQEGPFELSLECKKGKRKGIPGGRNSLCKGVNIHSLFGAEGGLGRGGGQSVSVPSACNHHHGDSLSRTRKGSRNQSPGVPYMLAVASLRRPPVLFSDSGTQVPISFHPRPRCIFKSLWPPSGGSTCRLALRECFQRAADPLAKHTNNNLR